MKSYLYRVASTVVLLMFAVDAAGQVVALKMPDADEVVIGNPLVSRDADNIIVEYDLLMGEDVSSCNMDGLISSGHGVPMENEYGGKDVLLIPICMSERIN